MKKPPKLGSLLFRMITDHENGHSIIGDAEEEYQDICRERGLLYARCWYWLQIFLTLIFIVKQSYYWSVAMLYNYLKIALRNIQKHKGYSFINIMGLAIGMACCLLIFLYIQDELNYDNHHEDLDRLYRVVMHFESKSFTRDFAKVGPSVALKLRQDFPQVESAARMMRMPRPLIRRGENKFYENRCYYAESELFDMLSFRFLRGDPVNAPRSVVISESISNKYFGIEDPIGKTLEIDSETYEITGIIVDYPENTHLKCDILVSFKTIEEDGMESDWGWTNFHTYIKLRPNVHVKDFRARIRRIEDRYVGEEKMKERGMNNTYSLQWVKRIHLHSHLASETEPPGNPLFITITGTIGLLILVIACVNFMNLATARFSNRAKEVGMRKVMGARRQQLIVQFLGESLVMSFCSFLLALFLAGMALPLMNDLANKTLTFRNFVKPTALLASVSIIFVVGFMGGCYPAFFLSVFRPSIVLKGGVRRRSHGAILRKILVVGQFVVSIILLISTLVVVRQLDYMKNSHLGFNKEQKLILPVKAEYLSDMGYESLKSEFLKLPQVRGATVSSGIPGYGVGAWATSLFGVEDDRAQAMAYLFLDHDFIEEYGVGMAVGRAFRRSRNSDLNGAFIINETGAKAMGWHSPQEALGKQIDGRGGVREIIGVVKDFHFSGLQDRIEPMVFALGPDNGVNRFNPTGFLTLTLNSTNLTETLPIVKEKWLAFHPDIPYRYFFIDDIFDRYYRSELLARKIIGLFTFLGLFVACLGLLGLASFTAEQRTQEIGIRKVVGASVTSIVMLLSGEFVKWVAMANVIAWPAAYFAAKWWLRDFAYRIGIEPYLFISSAFLVLLIAMLTVSYQAIRAARANPVKSLRYE